MNKLVLLAALHTLWHVALAAGCVHFIPDWHTRGQGMGKEVPPKYWVRPAITGVTEGTFSEKGTCSGNVVAHAYPEAKIEYGNKSNWVVDTSVTMPWEIEEGILQTSQFIFSDPETGERLACRESWVHCRKDGATHGTNTCDKVERPPDNRKIGKPRIKVSYPQILLSRAGYYGAPVTFRVSIEGELTEEFWCPGVEVLWPDDTRAYKESDCDPWDGTQVAMQQSWKFTKWFSEGTTHAEFRLKKVGKTIAREVVTVNVRGGGE